MERLVDRPAYCLGLKFIRDSDNTNENEKLVLYKMDEILRGNFKKAGGKTYRASGLMILSAHNRL